MAYTDDDWLRACKECGKCCHGNHFWFATGKEIKRIAAAGHTGFHKGNSLLSDGNHCVFFRGSKCSINAIKPMDCRRYPLMHMFDQGELCFFLDLGCPIALKIPEDEIRQIMEETKSFIASMAEAEKEAYKRGYMAYMKKGFDFD